MLRPCGITDNEKTNICWSITQFKGLGSLKIEQ